MEAAARVQVAKRATGPRSPAPFTEEVLETANKIAVAVVDQLIAERWRKRDEAERKRKPVITYRRGLMDVP